MATKKNLGKNYEGKLFCVSITRYIDSGDPTFTVLPKLYVSLASAMEEVAGIVNETLAYEKKKKKRVKPMDCSTALLGGYSVPTVDGSLVVRITAFERPWSVQYMDCDNMEHNVELFPDKESAVEAMICCLSVQNDIVPPTINHEDDDRDENIDYNLNFTFNKAQKRTVRAALSNTFGFGGHNACCILKKYNG